MRPDGPKRPPIGQADPGVGGELRQDRYVGDTDLTHWFTPFGRILSAGAQRISANFGPYATLIVTIVLGLGIAVGLSIAVEQIYDAVTDADGVAALDRPLLEFALTLRSPIANTIVTGFTDIAGTIGMRSSPFSAS